MRPAIRCRDRVGLRGAHICTGIGIGGFLLSGLMNVNLLIDAVIRQTTILIAQLATSAGLRAPLANLANAVFLDLADELEAQGVSRKVAADMFGMALRSYQSKVRRLAARRDDEHLSVWEAVFDFIREGEVVARADVMRRFSREDEELVRGILFDLVESGLVFQKGRGDAIVYRLASAEDFERVTSRDEDASLEALVWLNVYLHAPVTAPDLTTRLRISESAVQTALDALVREGRIGEQDGVYEAEVCVVPVGDAAGWEAALFDHYNALVTALCVKLRNVRLRSLPDDVIGGSTYSFDVWEGHPFEARVLGLLADTRRELSKLRAEVDDYNATVERPDNSSKVTFYFGQSVIQPEES